MKPRFFAAASLITVLISSNANLSAAGVVKLETNIYVLKGFDARDLDIPGAKPASAGGGVILRSPANARFGDQTLSLNGGQFSWSGEMSASDQISRIETPDVVIANGTPAELLCTSPVQYMEKGGDGRLQIREIPGDSPDAPHWRLKFSLGKDTARGGDMNLSCDLDVAVVSKRESLDDVKLDIGKPVLARFNEKLALKVPPGEWSAFVVRSPSGGDYTLLTLIKAVPQNFPSGIASNGQTMSAGGFAEFASGTSIERTRGNCRVGIESDEPGERYR